MIIKGKWSMMDPFCVILVVALASDQWAVGADTQKGSIIDHFPSIPKIRIKSVRNVPGGRTIQANVSPTNFKNGKTTENEMIRIAMTYKPPFHIKWIEVSNP